MTTRTISGTLPSDASEGWQQLDNFELALKINLAASLVDDSDPMACQFSSDRGTRRRLTTS